MNSKTKEDLIKAINNLSEYGGKMLNNDVPQGYCDDIWTLIEFAQYHLRQSDFNDHLKQLNEECKCEDKNTRYHLTHCSKVIANPSL